MSDFSPFDASPDAELGVALRDALEMPFGGAFVNRVRARLVARQRTWDEELAGWFWQGLVAASLVTVLAGWGLDAIAARDDADLGSSSVASQLLEGATPGASVLMASMRSAEAP